MCKSVCDTNSSFFRIRESVHPGLISDLIELERYGYIKTADASPDPMLCVLGMEIKQNSLDDECSYEFCIKPEEHQSERA